MILIYIWTLYCTYSLRIYVIMFYIHIYSACNENQNADVVQREIYTHHPPIVPTIQIHMYTEDM